MRGRGGYLGHDLAFCVISYHSHGHLRSIKGSANADAVQEPLQLSAENSNSEQTGIGPQTGASSIDHP